MKSLSIADIQELLKGKTAKEGGEILSTFPSGNWCGIWHDWFCRCISLKARASKFVPYIKALKGEWTKTHKIWLLNTMPGSGSIYDEIRISPLEGRHYNIGFSWGNNNTRERQVFDTRSFDIVGTVGEYAVENSKDASDLVNKLMNDKDESIE